MTISPAKTFLLPVMTFFVFATVLQNVFAADAITNLPPPAKIKINFDHDIRPILETSCLRCHGPQKTKSHYRLDYREGALAGGDNNTNDIVPGASRDSLLIAYVARQVPDMEMPPPNRGEPLTRQQISLLRAWIDQGANWNTTNQQPSLNLVLEPIVGGTIVNGNQAKFREIQGTKEGASGGAQNFSMADQIGPNEKISLDGYAIVPDQDYNFNLALDKTDLGFIHAGFDQWRKYYATDGGYNPTVFPSQFVFDNDLHVDDGRAWIDFGLALPRLPQIVLGYEYQYRIGNESTLDWNDANGKNIYPATQSLNEQTHTVKLNISKSFDDWRVENNAQISFYSINNQGNEPGILFGGTTPDQFITTKDNYKQIQGMDTLMLDKQLWEWWYLSGGFYYSQLSGNDYFNQTTIFGPPISSTTTLSSQKITLTRQSEIFSIANLFTPLNYLTLSLGTQNEWTRETGFSDGIPDLELGGTVPANSSLDEFKASQNANFRFTRIPFSIISGDAQLSEDYYDIFQSEDATELQRHTAANRLFYDVKTGFSTSPWEWVDLTVQLERQVSGTDYNQLQDLWQGVFGPTNGYPAFILHRMITSDEFETKLALRPAPWLKMMLTYQISKTDYATKTDPAIDPGLGNIFVSPGGDLTDGHYQLQTYGVSATLTPFRRMYLYGAFTYSPSRITTADNGDPSIVPYEGHVFTVTTSANYILSLKTSLQLSYNFSSADYSQNNFAAGVPAGLDYQRNDVIVGFTRKLTKNLSGSLHYEFSQYREPSTANVNNFTANGIMATLTYHWL